MNRWIAFDRDSVAAVFAATQIAPELHDAGDALGAALSAERNAVVLMPARVAGSAMLVQIRRMPQAKPEEQRYEATGFLGLIDEPVYEEDPAPPKKWWQKLWD